MTVAVLVSRADSASLTIRDALLAQGGWVRARFDFDAHPVHERGGVVLAEIEGWHIHAEHVDERLAAQAGPLEAILFASRHRAESGSPALTVHPIGNLGDAADVGGEPGRLAPAAPRFASRILRGLRAGLRAASPRRSHRATFEATHHGPLVATPAGFVEIGTSEADWRDASLGGIVARAIAEATASAAGPSEADAPVVVALGGSHYAPRASDLALSGKADVGHIVPGYQLDAHLPVERIVLAARATPGATHYFVDARGFTVDIAPYITALAALGLHEWK
ncbi:MAG: D-aminoacyl-tRNA deacylase [Thermoplasmatota archaeon]